MKINVNGRVMTVEDDLDIRSLIGLIGGSYDVLLRNGFMAGAEDTLVENDEVALIKKGVMPSEEELETLMCSRHTPKVHEKLKKAKVLIAGLGGLGSNIAVALARVGIGELRLIDFDVVEPSNLNRQSYEIGDLGKYKTKAIKEQLLRINPYNNYITSNMKIEKEDVTTLCEGVDVVVEAFDNPQYKAMLVNEVLAGTDKPIVSASGMAGLHNPNTIQTKQIGKRLFLAGDGISEAGVGEGLMAPRVIIAAGHQATTVCQILLREVEL